MEMLTRPRTALNAALACLGGLVVTGILAELVPAAHVRDSASLQGFASLRDSKLSLVLERIAHIADGGPYTLLGVAIVLAALARERRRLAIVVGVVLVLAPATSELLKQVLATPRSTNVIDAAHVAAASWPSGHATASMTLALCTVLVAPRHLRPLVTVIGGLFTLAVCYAVLVWVWHFPSDVIGGLFVAATYALLGVAFLRRWPDPIHREAEARPRPPSGLWPAVALGVAAAAVGLALAVQRRGAIAEHISGQLSFVAGAVTIAGLVGGLAVLLAFTARSS